ncbi:MAG: GH36-type glycosyl hydrolase domain-containing protein [Candidatus Limivicinus sp.]|jgi:cyclic beta-1,2-glucan synthetase
MNSINSAVYIEDNRLCDYAESAAKLLCPMGETGGRSAAKSLRDSYRSIRRSHEEIARRYGEMASPPAACEWLLDNWYMIQREYQSVLPELYRGRRLRYCGEGLIVTALSRMLLSSGRGKITEERFSAFLDGFQRVTVLRRAELNLLPAAMGAAVIEAAAEICRDMRSASDTDDYAPALEALFTTLRLFGAVDMEKLIRRADVTNAILGADPTGDYGRMDSGTKLAYLQRVELLARRAGIEEPEYALRIVKKAKKENRHLGFFLFPETGDTASGLYIAANVILTLFITLLAGFICASPAGAALLLLPVSETVKSLIDFILLHIVPPKRLFRMDTEKGVPQSGRTICVISTLLGPEADAGRLEELYQACKSEGSSLSFGLLADLPGAGTRETAEDEALIRPVREAVSRLNRKYGGRFYLFTRKRSYDGEAYTGSERKRGAIIELAKLLCDRESALEVTGEKDALIGTRYILTLDSDTRIYPGSAGQLIGAMLHPLCRPVIDRKHGLVKSGHAIIHPRIDTELKSAGETDFAIIFAGIGGSDPYGSLCGELYMDAFGSGGFAGKGLIDASALLSCTEDFPKGRVLSHDAPEGAFLRGAYMGDTEFSDSFPSKPLAYYRRQHRWIRGDWQNLPFIFKKGLRDIERWRLFDSLRRSLIPPATLTAILAGFFLPDIGITVAAWAALAALLSRLFLSLADCGLQHREKPRLRRYTRILSGAGGAIVHSFIRLWLLPYEAWVSLSAVCSSLWRMLVSHKKLLQWQTAAQTGAGAGFESYIREMWFPVALGLLLMSFCPVVIGKSSGLLWLLSPAAAAALALPARKDSQLSDNEEQYLLEAARRSYAYFESFCTAGDSFLPPDNFQEQPPVGLARRSSPTNIGLYLASNIAAAELGFISESEAAKRTKNTLSVLERMPRFMGHFYNWYDTRSLRPLMPPFISTVDSGNMYAGLLCCRQAMLKYGETDAAARLKRLMDDMDFAPLYDSVRGLFHICYDTVKNRGAGGWYDLMASEAMLTSYITVAKGDVPVKHWRRLSRAQLQKDGYRGLASWTGTMFEYLMPELFLPVYRGSLLYESGRFCLYAQKRRVWAGKPWGISESAFYSLDSALNYRYKAHGCGALALKRGLDSEMVVSPYSSFLALAIDPQGSIRNLRRLEAFGALGRFGFIEALDFTPSRCRSDTGEQVRCYMAHHIGMSVIAAANALCGGVIQRLFMSNPEMSAFSLLLQERLDEGSVIIRRENSQVPERFERSALMRWKMRGGEEDTGLSCCVLSNGAYNILAGSRGHSRAVCGPCTVYDCGSDFAENAGVNISLSGSTSAELIPCTGSQLWELGEDYCRIRGGLDSLSWECGLSAAYGESGELRTVSLRSPENTEADILLSFRPILAVFQDYINHPAFWMLGIKAENADGSLLLRRLPRGDCPELWLCLASSRPMSFSAGKNAAAGWLSQPEVRASVHVNLPEDESISVRFALCLGTERQAALDGAQRILVSGELDRGNMVSAGAVHLKMSSEEVGAAMAMLKSIWKDDVREAAAKEKLWPFGVSGDLPIVCCDGRALEWEKILRSFCLLKSCGVNCDLVYFTDEQGEYQQPVFRRVSGVLSSFGLDSLIASPGGVHFVPISAAELFISRAAFTVGAEKPVYPGLPKPCAGAPRRKGCVPAYEWRDDSFRYTVSESLPPKAWQMMLSNGSFGCIAADCGSGNMWYKNAREMRINLPPEDISAVEGSEALWLQSGDKRISLFAANDGFSCRVSYSPGAAVWEKELGGRRIKTTAFIPRESAAKVLLIEGAEGMKLCWTLEPVLGSSNSKSLRMDVRGHFIAAENPESYIPGVVFLASCSENSELSCSYSRPAMMISAVAEDITVFACGCCSDDELADLCRPDYAIFALNEVRAQWQKLLGRIKIQSSSPALDHYAGCWAPYQCIACRLLGRSSLYQSGGALGFRDQLQDSVNIILLSPSYARERIIDCCAHQYAEGDVMHWWHRHPDGDKGVRTRCSDDLLWLCWALAEYTEKTGDYEICSVKVPYISSPPLTEDERDRYEVPETSEKSASVLEHAKAALEACINRGFGEHGLPLMGSGDWNDGMDSVEGESVWLGWFLCRCASGMARLLEKLGDEGAEKCRKYSADAAEAAENAWAGRWYIRGYFPDGRPIGAGDRIDSISQSWAVLSGCESGSRRPELAVDSALRHLVDREHRIVKLFDPPYSSEEPSPGYLVSYGEGFRENGGQYTHGAIWLAIACFESGRPEDGWDILSMLLPENHDSKIYGAEPFVLPADVYSAPGHEGEAGWTWYTGSAGWYFRAVFEEMLGMRLKGGKLSLSPRLPAQLGQCSVIWQDMKGTEHRIDFSRGGLMVDGEAYSGGEIG